jgi:hypothetical protein
MSHHFDWDPETQDITDAYCFDGASDDDGPRTVFGMNVSPYNQPYILNPAGVPFELPGDSGFDPGSGNHATFYELKLDLNGDFVEDITWRFTFPLDSKGRQHVRIAQLTGADATDRTAPGRIITPPNTPIGQVVDLGHGITMFAGKRRDSFFNYLPFPAAMRHALFTGGNPNLRSLGPITDTFLCGNVYSVILELPAGITGTDPIQCWTTVAIVDQHHPQGIAVQRAAGPVINVIYNWDGASPGPGIPALPHIDYNNAVPSEELDGRPANPETDKATGIWGRLRDATAAVLEMTKTYSQGPRGKPTARAYAAYVADTVLPNVLRYTPGTIARWDPWNGIRNGKGLFEQSSDSFNVLALNDNVTTGLKQAGAITPYFPYLAEPLPPPASA